MAIKTNEYIIHIIILTILSVFSLISKATAVNKTSVCGNGITENFHQNLFVRHTRATNEQNADSNEKSEGKLQFIEPPKNVTLDIGSSHIMHCGISNPNAQIFWVKENKVLQGDCPLPNLRLFKNNTLFITNLDFHLSGIYSCIAILHTEAITVKAHIRVNSKPEEIRSCDIVLSKIPKDSTFLEGEFANLECLPTDPNVQLSWEKNEHPVHETNHIIIMKSGFIFFSTVKLEDSGKYACVARDMTTGCTKKSFAILQINHTQNVDEICGKIRAKEAEANEEPYRIVSGHTAAKGSHPWQVLFTIRGKIHCGGVLLNHRWIATAAHCFYNAERRRNFLAAQIDIILGENDRDMKEEQEFWTHVTHSSSIIIHPNFNIQYLYHDVALVRLKNAVRFTDYIIPICLGGREFEEHFFKPNVDKTNFVFGIVSGWGFVSETGNSARFLQEINIPVVAQKTCKEFVNYHGKLGEASFCAGYGREGSEDSCRGDSGGPFAVKQNGRWYLIGLVSGGRGCSRENHYGLYTKIPPYSDWINVIINSQ